MRLEILLHSCYPVSANYFNGNLTAKPKICDLVYRIAYKEKGAKKVIGSIRLG